MGRNRNVEDADWFEIADDLWREPGYKGKKLKLIADAQFPAPVVDEI